MFTNIQLIHGFASLVSTSFIEFDGLCLLLHPLSYQMRHKALKYFSFLILCLIECEIATRNFVPERKMRMFCSGERMRNPLFLCYILSLTDNHLTSMIIVKRISRLSRTQMCFMFISFLVIN